MHRQTRPFTTTNVFGLCGSGLRNTRCHGQHFHATPPATEVHEGGFLRNPTDFNPAAWTSGLLKVLHSLPDRLLPDGSTAPGFHPPPGLALLGPNAIDHGNEDNRLLYFTEVCTCPIATDFKNVYLPLAAEAQQIHSEVVGAGGNAVPGPMFSPIASARFYDYDGAVMPKLQAAMTFQREK
jgi:hypothetical protein